MRVPPLPVAAADVKSAVVGAVPGSTAAAAGGGSSSGSGSGGDDRVARLHALFAPLLKPASSGGVSKGSHAGSYDSSDAQDVLEFFRARLIADTATRYGYARVITGDSASRAAISIITATAKGRGDAIPNQLYDSDFRFNIPFVQPCRDVLTKSMYQR